MFVFTMVFEGLFKHASHIDECGSFPVILLLFRSLFEVCNHFFKVAFLCDVHFVCSLDSTICFFQSVKIT